MRTLGKSETAELQRESSSLHSNLNCRRAVRAVRVVLYVLQVSLKYVVNRDSDAYIHDVVEGHDLNVGCTLRLWSSTRFCRGNQSAGKFSNP